MFSDSSSTTATLQKADETYSFLCRCMPGGVSSPVRSAKGMGQPPLIASKGQGDLIFDVDDKGFIDYCCSWGALIHGHAFPPIIEAIKKRADLGTTFGATTLLEGSLAQKILEAYPSMEKVRFVSTGTEATMSALRLARGFTKRNLIVKFSGHYHGHADALLVKAGSGVADNFESSSAGVPLESIKNTICLPFNDFEAFRLFGENSSFTENLAAVIVEPVAANMGVVPPAPGFLELLREKTEEWGSLLIFDEVVTGFRLGLGGAQELFHIKPDITCLGKIVGGGLPAAAFGGRQEIMDCLAPLGPVYQAGTLSGNPLAMEAGLQAVTLLEKEGFYEEIENKTRLLTDPIEEAIKTKGYNCSLQRVGSIFTLFFGRKSVNNFDETQSCDKEKFAAFFRYLFKNGVYIPPLQLEPWFISAAHTKEHLLYTRDLVIAFLELS